MIDDTKKKLKICCVSIGIGFISNVSINGSCLNRSKLHLNRKGSTLLAKNTASYVKLKEDCCLDGGDRYCVFIDLKITLLKI